MTIEAIRRVMHDNKPFKLRTADGEVIEIPHPDFIAVAPNGKWVIVTHTDDQWKWIDAQSITAIEGHGPQPETAGRR